MATTQTGVSLISLDFLQDQQSYRAVYDPETTEASMAVIQAVVEALDVDPMELEQLYSVVDPEALDQLLDPGNARSGVVHVSFTFGGCDTTVTSDGTIRISCEQATLSGDEGENTP